MTIPPIRKLTKTGWRLAGLFLLTALLGIYGCTAAVIGGGAAAGVGTYSYFTGKLTRSYEAGYQDTVLAARHTLAKLEIPIIDTVADGLKTEFNARRADQTPVTIEIVLIDKKTTEVSVRTGTVGLWDRRVSEQIQGYINEELGRQTAEAEKPAQESAGADTRPAANEGAQPEIIEEDLAEASGPAPVPAAPPVYQISPDSPNVIFFGNDSNDLSDAAIEKLDRIFEILTDKPEATLLLNGYSDSYGAASYNQMISGIRANAVKSYLVGKGIEPFRITALGHGSQNFIASNKTAEGRRMNRRVEIKIIE